MTNRLNEESIIQSEQCCWLCGNTNLYALVRHEAFYGRGRRQLSIDDKLTVLLCNDTCHLYGINAVHRPECNGNDEQLKREAQQAAMDYYGWTVQEFSDRYGRNYLDLEW